MKTVNELIDRDIHRANALINEIEATVAEARKHFIEPLPLEAQEHIDVLLECQSELRQVIIDAFMLKSQLGVPN